MPTCLVLMCTYNGERFLREQIDSVLAQRGVDVTVKAADDRSTDGTVAILEEYRNKYDNFSYSVNPVNKNFTYNFLDLLFSVKETAYDYYAFCDQDDIWMPEKLAEAIGTIEARGQTPNGVLYCSNLRVSDMDGKEMGLEEDESILRTNRCTYLYENICTGCTTVFDRKFKDACTQYYPQGIRLHDHWLFLIAVYTADMVYDMRSFIRYRQHIDNQVGSRKNVDGSLRAQFRRFCKQKETDTTQRLTELLKGYGEKISERDKKNIRIVANYKKSPVCRLKFAVLPRFRRRRRDLRFRIRVLFGKV